MSAATGVEVFYSLWAAGQCAALDARLSPQFAYTVSDDRTPGTPAIIDKAHFSAACAARAGRFVAETRDVLALGPSWSSTRLVGADTVASGVNKGSPCVIPWTSSATVEQDASGNITTVHKSFPIAHYNTFAARCENGTRIAPPDSTPGALPLADFAVGWMNLLTAGQCDDAAALEASDFTFINGPGARPMNKQETTKACAQEYVSTPVGVAATSAVGANGTAIVSGIATVAVMDPTTKKPCGVNYDHAATIVTRVDPTSGKLVVTASKWLYDAAAVGKAVAAKCHFHAPLSLRA